MGISKQLIILLLLIVFSATDSFAELTPEQLVKNSYHRDTGKDSSSKIKMVLNDSKGRARERIFESSTFFKNDLRKQLIKFTSPKNIKGTSFLSWENSTNDDDQFLYLPAAGRVRRVVSGQKSKAFVNSDYSYEDMQRRHYSRDTVKKVGSGKYLGYDCTKVRLTPKDPTDTQYSYVDSCIADKLFITLHAHFFDKKGKLLKKFVANDIKNIQGIWTITKSIFTNIQNKTSTELIVSDVNYNTGLSEKIFTKTYLKK